MSRFIEIACKKLGETENALRIYDGGQSVWIPKSQIEETDHDFDTKGEGTIMLPEWLAIEKGLV